MVSISCILLGNKKSKFLYFTDAESEVDHFESNINMLHPKEEEYRLIVKKVLDKIIKHAKTSVTN